MELRESQKTFLDQEPDPNVVADANYLRNLARYGDLEAASAHSGGIGLEAARQTYEEGRDARAQAEIDKRP